MAQQQQPLSVSGLVNSPTARHNKHSLSGVLRQTGFTLLELVIVMMLVSILAISVLVNLPTKAIDLRASAEQISAAIRYAQSLSMTKGARYRVNFATVCPVGGINSCYWVSNLDDSTKIPEPATEATTIQLETAVTLVSSNSFVVFDGRGIPYATSTMPGTALSSNATITLTASGAPAQTVVITPETGLVTAP